jgi:hypothetical protein
VPAKEGPSRDGFPAELKRFLDQHCVACHGPEVQKRRLRLDTLPLVWGEKDPARTWTRVLDKVSRGEMPPKGEAPVSESEKRPILAGLDRRLNEASLRKQEAEGRVVLRRLNRIEYETTLRDLLQTPVEVKELLPDDNIAAGFDKVSAALEISSSHLLRYQQAAEKALESIVPKEPRRPIKAHWSGKEITQQVSPFRDALGKLAKLEGDSLVLYARLWDYIPCATPPAPQAGHYRVRLSARAVGTQGKPMPVKWVVRGLYDRDEADVRGVRDVPAEAPAVAEEEIELKARQVVHFAGWSLPTPRKFEESHPKVSLDSFTGPGLRVEWIELEGPLDPWPPRGYERLFPGIPLRPASVAREVVQGRPLPPEPASRPDQWWIYDPLVMVSLHPKEDAERLMRAFLAMAFRRPVAGALEQYYVNMVRGALEKGKPFQEAMVQGYKAALCSPHFLFLAEPPRPDRGPASRPVSLDDYAIAARLSYFFWSSAPDAELLSRAARGDLSRPEVLRAQVERLLGDPKARRFIENFAGQWLDLRSINATSPDPEIYPEFDDFLFWSMPRETERFFEEVVRSDRSLLDFVQSDWSFLNERLARHYGIPGVLGGELRKEPLPAGCRRGGVLTQASILKVTADGTRTSPVLRGKWVLERILGRPPAPPPPDIPAIEPDIRGATTIRQQLDKHRSTAACASCHRQIDPPGFALESYDVIGGWRDFYRATGRAPLVSLPRYPAIQVPRGPDVEMGFLTPEGRAFKDIDEYKRILLADKDGLARALVQKLLTYATGADLEFADREVVDELIARLRPKDYRFRTLLHEVVQCRVFLCK